MLDRSRLQSAIFFAGLIAGAGSLFACHRDKPQGEKTSVVLGADSARQSLAGLKPKLAALNTKFAALHKQFDPLPPNLPGFGEVRAKFYNTDIGLGVMGSKLSWLEGRLDAALKSSNKEELQQVTKDIARTHEEFAQIDRIALELLHQVLPFQRMAELEAKQAQAGSSSFVRVLATGKEIQADAEGIEQGLLEFIEDPGRQVDQTTWIDFDRLGFAERGAKLDEPRSDEQLQRVAEILAAYPRVTLKVGSYAEAPATSPQLAAERARAVKKELGRLGVAPARLALAGPGADRPSCSANDAAACASKAGRVAVRITAK